MVPLEVRAYIAALPHARGLMAATRSPGPSQCASADATLNYARLVCKVCMHGSTTPRTCLHVSVLCTSGNHRAVQMCLFNLSWPVASTDYARLLAQVTHTVLVTPKQLDRICPVDPQAPGQPVSGATPFRRLIRDLLLFFEHTYRVSTGKMPMWRTSAVPSMLPLLSPRSESDLQLH